MTHTSLGHVTHMIESGDTYKHVNTFKIGKFASLNADTATHCNTLQRTPTHTATHERRISLSYPPPPLPLIKHAHKAHMEADISAALTPRKGAISSRVGHEGESLVNTSNARRVGCDPFFGSTRNGHDGM